MATTELSMTMSEACAALRLPRAIGYELFYAGILTGRRARGGRYEIDAASVAELQRLQWRVERAAAAASREQGG
jgi:hypothetical protein